MPNTALEKQLARLLAPLVDVEQCEQKQRGDANTRQFVADEHFERAALQWWLGRGTRNGRVAWQFARNWAGTR